MRASAGHEGPNRARYHSASGITGSPRNHPDAARSDDELLVDPLVTGLEGHGSQPDKGVNAVEYATRYVMRLLVALLLLATPALAQVDARVAFLTKQLGLVALPQLSGLRLDREQEFDGSDLSIHRISATPERLRST